MSVPKSHIKYTTKCVGTDSLMFALDVHKPAENYIHTYHLHHQIPVTYVTMLILVIVL